MSNEEKVVIYSSNKPRLSFMLPNKKVVQFKNGVFEARGPMIQLIADYLEGSASAARYIRVIDVDKARSIALAHQQSMRGAASQGAMSSLARGRAAMEAKALLEASQNPVGDVKQAQEQLSQIAKGLTAGDDPSFVVAETVETPKPSAFANLIFPGKKPG